jgi:hypothetical protein
MLRAGQDKMLEVSPTIAWAFPVLLAITIVIVVSVVAACLGLKNSGTGDALMARLTWATAAMLFTVLFVFFLVVCVVLMFVCGKDEDAMIATTAATSVGAVALLLCVTHADAYLGPKDMHDLLDQTAFCLGGVRTISAWLDGFAIWSAILVIATSCVIARNEIETSSLSTHEKEQDLSVQLRGAKVLMYTAAALLIAGVAETSALHKWPANDTVEGTVCPRALPLKWSELARTRDKYVAAVDTTATAISTAVGTVASLVLAAAYLPLAFLLRQRAYHIITPYARTEAWLGIHGFALQPTQQLAKVLLVLSPLVAGGPLSYLITLLSR